MQCPPLAFFQLDNRYSRDFIPIIDSVLTMLPVSPVGQLIGNLPRIFASCIRARAIFHCINAYPYIEAFNQAARVLIGFGPVPEASVELARKSDPELLADLQKRAPALGLQITITRLARPQ